MSWRDKAEQVGSASESPEDGSGSTKVSSATHGGDDSIAAIKARALAAKKPVSELESLLLGATKGATASFAGELGNLVAKTPSERKNLSDYYVRAGKDNPVIFALGEGAARLPAQLVSPITAGLMGAANAIGESNDKMNSVDEAIKAGTIEALFSPKALGAIGRGAKGLISGARSGVASKLAGLSNVLAPGEEVVQYIKNALTPAAESAASGVEAGAAKSATPAAQNLIEQATGDLAEYNPNLSTLFMKDKSPLIDLGTKGAEGMTTGQKKLGAHAIETLDRLAGKPTSGPLRGDMGMEVFPYKAASDLAPTGRHEMIKELALDNPALGDLMFQKIADRGLNNVLSGSPAKSAIQSLKSKIGNEAATMAAGASPAAEEKVAEKLASDVGTLADAGLKDKAKFAHKLNMLENKAYAEGFKKVGKHVAKEAHHPALDVLKRNILEE